MSFHYKPILDKKSNGTKNKNIFLSPGMVDHKTIFVSSGLKKK
jgi:hypothetical protein